MRSSLVMERINTRLTSRDLTDAELLARLLLKDGKAWREFHRRYDRLIYRCIHRVAGRFKSSLCSDFVDDVYASLLVALTSRDMHKLRSYDPSKGSKLSTWIGMLATRQAWDLVRKQTRAPQTDDIEDRPLESNAPNLSDALEAREEVSRVNAAVALLSERDQRFVSLYFVDGMEPEEIAEQMRISVKTVYTKKHKIRARLLAAVA